MKKIRVYALSAATAAVLTATALAADTGTAFGKGGLPMGQVLLKGDELEGLEIGRAHV